MPTQPTGTRRLDDLIRAWGESTGRAMYAREAG